MEDITFMALQPYPLNCHRQLQLTTECVLQRTAVPHHSPEREKTKPTCQQEKEETYCNHHNPNSARFIWLFSNLDVSKMHLVYLKYPIFPDFSFPLYLILDSICRDKPAFVGCLYTTPSLYCLSEMGWKSPMLQLVRLQPGSLGLVCGKGKSGNEERTASSTEESVWGSLFLTVQPILPGILFIIDTA